jgi:hypothetical protein
MVTKMNELDMQNTPIPNRKPILELLSEEFNGASFYGLEYILDDFFPTKKASAANFTLSAPVDWFGLYG